MEENIINNQKSLKRLSLPESVVGFTLRKPAVAENYKLQKLKKRLIFDGLLRLIPMSVIPMTVCIIAVYKSLRIPFCQGLILSYIAAGTFIMSLYGGCMSMLSIIEAMLLKEHLSNGDIKMLDNVKLSSVKIRSPEDYTRSVYKVTLCDDNKIYRLYVCSNQKVSEEYLLNNNFTFFADPDTDSEQYNLILVV